MDCEFYYPLLSAHIDGENSEAEEAQLQEHLAVCPHCRALLKECSRRRLRRPPI